MKWQFTIQWTLIACALSSTLIVFQEVIAKKEDEDKKDVKKTNLPKASPQDINVAQSLFDEVNKKNKKDLTQTEAWLSIPEIQKDPSVFFGLAQWQSIINEVLERERALTKDYYVFYIAISRSERLLLDITRRMYRWTVGKLGVLDQGAFQFIKYNFIIDQLESNINKMLSNEVKEEGIISDGGPLSNRLIKVDLTPFGNITTPMESTWHQLVINRPWTEIPITTMNALCEFFGYPTDFSSNLIGLSQLLKNTDGSASSDLYQIFVPKDKIDKTGYTSWRLGLPLNKDIIMDLLTTEESPITTMHEANDLSYGTIDKAIRAFKDIYKKEKGAKKEAKEIAKKVQPISKQLAKDLKNALYAPDKFLTKFLQNPEKEYIPGQQARLFTAQRLFFSPKEGLAVYRYSTINKSTEEKYINKQKEIFRNMEKERATLFSKPQILQKGKLIKDIGKKAKQ